MSGDSDWGVYYTADGVPYYYNKRTKETSWDKPAALKSAAEAEADQKGEWVWVPHATQGFVVAQVGTKFTNGDTQCTTEDRQVIQVPKNVPLIPVIRSSLQRIEEDLVQMDEMNEPLVIHNLRERFKKNAIYTHVGTILISVNPFKPLPLYSPTIIDQYAHKGTKELPPHVFNISSAAYNNLVSDKVNQSILISGESGAGKTEATKVVLQYLAEVAGSVNGVEENILLANPILEAFGNAKTLRNNNSSRFGKWVEIHFDKQGRICGAKTVNYLLEKTRVVHQTQGERNYHIFYQLCSGAPDPLRKKLNLGKPDEYKYLNQSGCITIEGTDDAKDFQEVQDAMRKIKFTDAERESVFQIISAILHLGNINYKSVTIKYNNADVQASEIENPPVLEKAASLLQVSAADLKKAICFRRMVIKGQAPTDIPLDAAKAKDNCNALAKTIYGNLFDWLVRRINISMAPPANLQTNIIGVLDIFGFEIFETNSFEQLCINFANEKLQQHFNSHTFKLEEQVYQEEKIPFTHVEFIDNQPCLDLIEQKPQGILCMLDEEIVLPRTTDETFLQKLHQTHEKKHEKFVRPVKLKNSFIIKHYAGDVIYAVDNFLEKNKDVLNEDLVLSIETTTLPLLAELFPKGQTTNRKSSLGNQFRGQLAALMATLGATTPHYIRCVKPNSLKAPNNFDGTMVLQQLRYAGVFEAIHIRKTGYPFRRTHQEFFKRYRLLNRKAQGKDYKALATALIGTFPADLKKELNVGVTKVLYKAGPHRKLELFRSVEIEKSVIKLQAGLRGWQSRKISKELKRVRPILLAAIKARVLEKIDDALKQSENCRFEMKPLTDARKLRHILVEEKRITGEIGVLMKQDHEKVYEKMAELLKQAKAIDMKTDDVTKLEKVVSQIAERRKVKAELATGVQNYDRKLLEDNLKRVKEVGLTEDIPEVKQAQEALKRITEEEKLVAELEKAIQNGACQNMDHSTIVVNALEGALKKANSFVCKTEKGKSLVTKATITLDLRKALIAEDWPQVNTLLMKAQKEGINNDELKSAREEVAYLTAVEELTQRLWDAITARDEEVLQFGIEQADTLGVGDTDVGVQAKDILARIQEARKWLQAGLHYVNEEQLQTGVDLSRDLQYDTEEVRSADKLLTKVKQLKKAATEALAWLEREAMQKTLDESRAINLQTEDVAQLVELLENTPIDKFLQMQLKVATKMNDRQRAVKVTIQIKDVFFAQFEHMFVWNKYMKFRSREEYASAKLIGGKAELKSGMLLWSKKPIPTSLLVLDPHLVKPATRLFKNILGYMGDKQYSYPETLAADLVENAKLSKELHDEVYVQILKQLTSNPFKEGVQKGWALLAHCLKHLAPSDDFANYLEIFLRKNAPPTVRHDLIVQLHTILYGFGDLDGVGAVQKDGASTSGPTLPPRDMPAPVSRIQVRNENNAPKLSVPPPIAAAEVAAAALPPPLVLPPPPPPIAAVSQDPVAVVLYDYVPSGPGQLSLRQGDRILIVAKDPSGWWTGELNGVLGHFPSNYTQEM